MKLTWLVIVGFIVLSSSAVQDSSSEEVNDSKDESRETEDQIYYLFPKLTGYKSKASASKHKYNRWMTIRDLLKNWWYRQSNVKPTPTLSPILTFGQWLKEWKGKAQAIECGLQEIEPRMIDLRIVGGTTAVRGSWPWMVSLKVVGQHFCGGILISRDWVITAAHCMLFMPGMDDPTRWEIRLGRFDPGFNVTEPKTEQRFNISGKPIFYDGIDIQRLYNGLPVDYDIVLLKLDRPAIITPWVKPICLPTEREHPQARQRCIITGYGLTAPNVGFSVKLKQAVVPIVGYETCRELKGYAKLLTPRMVCAGYEYGGVDTCKMDSGGPLQCFRNGRWVATGLTSWGDAGGNGCGMPLRPGVYTKISSYVVWIQTMIYKNYVQIETKKIEAV